MGKNFKYYVGIWCAVVALFNVIIFILPREIMGESAFGESFWVAYIFMMLGFVGQLVIAWLALKGDGQRLFYRWSLLSTSITLLIVMLVWGIISMVVPGLSIGICVMIDLIIVILGAIMLLRAQMATSAVEEIDRTIKTKTFFIKSLTVDVDSLLARITNIEMKEDVKKVYEAVRYSDPMSDDNLSGIETEISLRFAELSKAVMENDSATVKGKSAEIMILLNERNKKCKFLK